MHIICEFNIYLTVCYQDRDIKCKVTVIKFTVIMIILNYKTLYHLVVASRQL